MTNRADSTSTTGTRDKVIMRTGRGGLCLKPSRLRECRVREAKQDTDHTTFRRRGKWSGKEGVKKARKSPKKDQAKRWKEELWAFR